MSFLACPILCHQFVSTIDNNDNYVSSRCALATKALEIMDQYHLVHPQAHMLVDYLTQNHVQSKFTTLWLDHTASRAEERSDTLYGSLLNSQSLSQTYESTMELLAIYTIQNRFGQSLALLQTYGSSAEFSNDPTTTKQIVNHKYLQYLLFSYVTSVYKYSWFEDVEDEVSNDMPVNVSPHKNGDTFLKRANYFYNKKRPLLTEETEDEVKCYWLLRWTSCLALLSSGSVSKFLEEFAAISDSSSTVNPLSCMEIDQFSIKEPLLLGYALASSMMRPFSGLLQFDEVLAEHFANTTSTDQVMTLLVHLKDSNFVDVHKHITSPAFNYSVQVHLGFALLPAFVTRLQLVITFKIFILVIQSIKRIPRAKLLALIGVEDTADNMKLLVLMLTVLGLNNFGVGYNTSGDFFFNNRQTRVPLEEEIDRLAHNLKGETMSAIVNAALLEKIQRS